jgi:hypothetical protein
MPFYWAVLAIVVLVSATFTLLMFTPVVVLVDSRSRDVKVRWSFLLSYVRPFPGADIGQKLSVAGISIPLPRPKGETSAKREEKVEPSPIEARNRRRKAGRFMWNCLLDGNIRSALVRRFRRLPIALWDAVEVSRLHCEVSLPDPALDGMLWGAVAAVDPASRTWLRSNFMGRNEVRTEVRLYPHRVVKGVLFFFLQLPYGALLKQWRAS